jgi:nucleoside-diphosphate-sugar epimerase
MKVLVTGANGFIGHALCSRLLADNFTVKGVVRPKNYNYRFPTNIDLLPLESVGPKTDWSKAIVGVDGVVHLAARVHIMTKDTYDPLTKCREINVAGTERLARESVSANVRRFIYMSSVKVNGEGRAIPYDEEDIPKPQDAYSASKWEAEKVLNKISKDTTMDTVILRSPMVYGPRVKANFLRLLKLVDRGIPLPLGRVNNRRSLIYLGNLVDAIITCIKHPGATGQTYLLSDGKDLSTPELIRLISKTMGRKSRLFPFPPNILKTIGKITGRSTEIDRLIGSLCVDSRKIRTMLGWNPPYTPEEGIRQTVLWYKKYERGQRAYVRW